MNQSESREAACIELQTREMFFSPIHSLADRFFRHLHLFPICAEWQKKAPEKSAWNAEHRAEHSNETHDALI